MKATSSSGKNERANGLNQDEKRHDAARASGFSVRVLRHADPADFDLLLDLRARVLRPGQPKERSHFPGDDAPGAVHLGAFDGGGRLVGIASVMEENGLRLRGMAVENDWRGRGVGTVLVRQVHAIASERRQPLWCNARAAAVGFYEKLGWAVEGEQFDLPDIGPHFRMCWQPPSRAAAM